MESSHETSGSVVCVGINRSGRSPRAAAQTIRDLNLKDTKLSELARHLFAARNVRECNHIEHLLRKSRDRGLKRCRSVPNPVPSRENLPFPGDQACMLIPLRELAGAAGKLRWSVRR